MNTARDNEQQDNMTILMVLTAPLHIKMKSSTHPEGSYNYSTDKVAFRISLQIGVGDIRIMW